MAHLASPVFLTIRVALTLAMTWPVALIIRAALRSGEIEAARGHVVKRSEQPGRFWFLLLGLLFLKGLAALAAAYVAWTALSRLF